MERVMMLSEAGPRRRGARSRRSRQKNGCVPVVMKLHPKQQKKVMRHPVPGAEAMHTGKSVQDVGSDIVPRANKSQTLVIVINVAGLDGDTMQR